MSLPQERSTAEQVFYTWVARSRSGSSSFTASALNKPSSSSSSSSSSSDRFHVFIYIYVCGLATEPANINQLLFNTLKSFNLS